MKNKIPYLRYIIALILLLSYWGYKELAPEFNKWRNSQAEKLIKSGNRLANSGYWGAATASYNLAILLGDRLNDSWAYNCRGIISWRKYAQYNKDETLFNKALKDYDRAEQLAGNQCYAAALTNKGLLYASKGDFEESIKYFDKALKCNPRDSKIYEEKTAALFNLGRYLDAIDFGKNAIKVIGEKPYLCFNIAYSYEMIGDYKKAVIYYDKVLKQGHNKNSAAYINSSYCKLMLRDYKGALDYAQAAIDLGSGSIHAYNFATFAALQKEDLKLAIEYNNRAFSLYESPNYLSYYNYAKIKYLQGDIEGAKYRLLKAKKAFEEDTETWQFEDFEILCSQLEQLF